MPEPTHSRFGVERDELKDLLAGEPSYRIGQVWRGLFEELRDPAEMTNLPIALRERLEQGLRPDLAPVAESHGDGGETIKTLWSLHDGYSIESVLMHYPGRSTVCVSTQAGCAMACGFCATGQGGFDRNLTPGEITEQVVRAARRARPRRLGNVVLMGMGEPLANFDSTWSAVERINGDLGIGARHVTISTVGIVPGIRRLAGQRLPVNLAVSLHSADPHVRDELVPINRRYPLESLAEACREWIVSHNRRLSLEWAMIHEVNDRAADVDMLAAFARPLGAHVNLIPLNPTPGYTTRGTRPERIRWFAEALADAGVNATIRRNRGTEVDAACGQLKASTTTPVRLSR